MAGSVEGEEQAFTIAAAVRDAGATVLRGGAFKPRTSPYAFQGLGEAGLELLRAPRRDRSRDRDRGARAGDGRTRGEHADIIQIGARNMQNYPLLRARRQAGKPVLLKRGMAATIEGAAAQRRVHPRRRQ